MHAIILAAGRGTRLRAVHQTAKCLLTIGDEMLLDRYVRCLDALCVRTLIVAGYCADDVRERVAGLAPAIPCEVVVNAEFEKGSIVSLARGLGSVDGPILLLDGDVYFAPALLERLVTSPHADALLVDVGSDFTGEEYLAGIDAGRVNVLRRGPVSGHESAGEWVGFAKLGATGVGLLRTAIDRQIAVGDTAGGYEDCLASLLTDVDVRCEATNGLAWVEIDFPEDAERAAALARRTSPLPPSPRSTR